MPAPTFLAGENLTAAELDWLVATKPRARVFHSTTQNVSTGTFTALSFNSVRRNIGPMWASGSNKRLTVPAGGGGDYLIGGHAHFQANTSGRRMLVVQLNGVTFLAGSESRMAGIGGALRLSVATWYPLAAGDFVELVAWQDSGVTLTVASQPNESPELWATWDAS